MILQLKENNKALYQPLFDAIRKQGLIYHYVDGEKALVVSNLKDRSLLDPFQSLIERTVEVDTPYQLASKKWKSQTSFDVKGVTVGKGMFNIMAGPCAVENEDQIFRVAEFLASKGVQFIRGGAYKPRTSPYSFRGLGTDGLKLISKAAKKYNLRVVTEIIDLSVLEEVSEYADVLQVGSRNMQNFHMLNELGKSRLPVLLKRGMHAKVKEWLLAAEYILSGGNDKVMLCERGIRSFDPDTRNVMDVGIIPLLKELSHLPVIADPSHGTGSASRVIPMALASAIAGADGLLVEVHPEPSKALSDSLQTISFPQFEEMLGKLRQILPLAGKEPDTGNTLTGLHTV